MLERYQRRKDSIYPNLRVSDKPGIGHLGITAENVAEKFGISRAEQDEFTA